MTSTLLVTSPDTDNESELVFANDEKQCNIVLKFDASIL